MGPARAHQDREALRRWRRRRVLETCAAAADALNAGQRPQRGDIHAAHAPPLPFPPCRNGVVRADIPFERRREGSPGGDSFFAGLNDAVSKELSAALAGVGLLQEYQALKGSYVHHYLIFFRRVFSEETYLAMNEGGERYSISLFTFEPEHRRRTYYAACAVLAKAFSRLYSARPHWGKYNPLTVADIEPLYPGLVRFREICRAQDRTACSRTPTRKWSWGPNQAAIDQELFSAIQLPRRPNRVDPNRTSFVWLRR